MPDEALAGETVAASSPLLPAEVWDACVERPVIDSETILDPVDPNFSINLPDVLADVDLAFLPVSRALHSWAQQNQIDLGYVTGADLLNLVARFTLTYLVSNGLAVVSPEGTFERWMDVERIEQWAPPDLEEPYAAALNDKLAEAVRRRALMHATAAMRPTTRGRQ